MSVRTFLGAYTTLDFAACADIRPWADAYKTFWEKDHKESIAELTTGHRMYPFSFLYDNFNDASSVVKRRLFDRFYPEVVKPDEC